jgi:hypothetical protein
MATIPQFPADLLSEHAQWHMDHMDETSPGEGVAFLEFHREFMAEFHDWYDSQPFADQAAVSPWPTLPQEVVGNLSETIADQLAAIAADPAAFDTEDDLGIAIHPLHDQIHDAAATAYDERELANPGTAPRYTEFWNLHGLIDAWFTTWQHAHVPSGS